jgi:hypothetical protein
MLELWLIVPAHDDDDAAAADDADAAADGAAAAADDDADAAAAADAVADTDDDDDDDAVPILRQINPVHDTASHFIKINFNIIILYTTPECSCFLKEEQML